MTAMTMTLMIIITWLTTKKDKVVRIKVRINLKNKEKFCFLFPLLFAILHFYFFYGEVWVSSVRGKRQSRSGTPEDKMVKISVSLSGIHYPSRSRRGDN